MKTFLKRSLLHFLIMVSLVFLIMLKPDDFNTGMFPIVSIIVGIIYCSCFLIAKILTFLITKK